MFLVCTFAVFSITFDSSESFILSERDYRKREREREREREGERERDGLRYTPPLIPVPLSVQ